MIDLDAIKNRLAAAAPGPWKPIIMRRSIDGDCVALVQAEAPNYIVATIIPQYSERETIPLLVAARADMDALVAEVEHLRGERAAVVAWLKAQVSTCAGDDDHAYERAATVIERGEHRREEEK